MNRRYMLLCVGAALMLGVGAYDRANRTETVVAANVVSVDSKIADEGPDMWQITVRTEAGVVALDQQQSRPNLSPEDRVCITRISRMGRADQHRIAPSSTSC